MNRVGGVWWTLGVLALALASCGGDDDALVESSEEIFCTASCRRGRACGSINTVGACLSVCRSEVTGMTRFRPEGVELVGACIQRLDCAIFFEEKAFVPCWDSARDALAPSAETREFCRGYSSAWFACGRWYDLERCERDWSLNEPPVFEGISSCFGVECEEFAACKDASLERFQ